jgi:hypothetical protein
MEKRVQNGELKSFISLIEEKRMRGILMYKNSPTIPLTIPGFFEFSLDQDNNFFYNLIKNTEEFEYSTLLNYYRDIASQYKHEVYFYAIRTRNLDKNFNSVLLISIKKQISLDEYAEIVDLFTFIMAAKIKIIAKEFGRNVEWKQIADEQSHSLKHDMWARDEHKKIISSYMRNNKAPTETVKKHWEAINAHDDQIRLIYDFNDAIRKLYMTENKFVEDTLKIQSIVLSDVLRKVLATIEYSLEGLGKDIEHNKKIRDSCFPKIEEDIVKF